MQVNVSMGDDRLHVAKGTASRQIHQYIGSRLRRDLAVKLGMNGKLLDST
jgi:hypothetical protein